MTSYRPIYNVNWWIWGSKFGMPLHNIDPQWDIIKRGRFLKRMNYDFGFDAFHEVQILSKSLKPDVALSCAVLVSSREKRGGFFYTLVWNGCMKWQTGWNSAVENMRWNTMHSLWGNHPKKIVLWPLPAYKRKVQVLVSQTRSGAYFPVSRLSCFVYSPVFFMT